MQDLSISHLLNGKYNFPLGTVFYRHKEYGGNGLLVKCKTTGYIWISDELGGIYSCIADEEVANMDCNWGIDYSKSTSISDVELFKALNAVDKIVVL